MDSPMLQAPAAPSGRRLAIGAAAHLLGFAVLTWAVLSGLTKSFDQRVAAVTLSTRTSPLTWTARSLTTLGSWPVLMGVAVAAGAILWLRVRRVSVAIAVYASAAVTSALVYLLKIAIGRARPDHVTLLGIPALDASFPSGHTTNGTVVWGTVFLLLAVAARRCLLRLTAVAGWVVLAAGIGWSRVYLGYHWPTDVVAGWMLAIAILLGETLLLVNVTSPGQIIDLLRREPTPHIPVPAAEATRPARRHPKPTLSHR